MEAVHTWTCCKAETMKEETTVSQNQMSLKKEVGEGEGDQLKKQWGH